MPAWSFIGGRSGSGESRSGCDAKWRGREHPHFTLDRTKKPKVKLKHVEANTMPLSLRKLVRTGTPYDKGVMG